jgi:DNA-binding transcriptional LysR family regulator
MGVIRCGDNGCVELQLRHLEYFLAVADTSSFTHAARRLHVVQSGVSATIKALESDLGAELFARTPAGATLTEAGHALLPHAQATINAARAARDAVDAIRGRVRGTVAVGTMTSINIVDLPHLVAELHTQHPEVAVQLRAAIGGTEELLRQLRAGDLDIAFLVFTDTPPADLHTRLIANVPLHLVVPADHLLAERTSIPLAALDGMPFVDCPLGYGNRSVIDNAFQSKGIQRAIALEITDIGTAAAHIRNGSGLGFLTQFLLDDYGPDGLITVPITDCDLQWRLHVATLAKRPTTTATNAFLTLLPNAMRHK